MQLIHINGTLYLPKGRITLKDTSYEGIQEALAENNYNVSLEEIKLVMNSAK